MKKSNHKEDIEFSLNDISLVSFSLENKSEFDIDSEDEIKFNLNVKYKVAPDIDLIYVQNNIEAKHNGKTLATMEVHVVFQINNLKRFVTDNNQSTIPKELLITFNSITISTTRGIWYSQMKGTYLEKILIPLVKPANFLIPPNERK